MLCRIFRPHLSTSWVSCKEKTSGKHHNFLRLTEAMRVEQIAANSRSTWWHTVPPLLDLRSLLYCCTLVPERSRDHVSGTFVSQTHDGITRCNYSESGAALSHEKRSARPNSMSYGLKFYRSVRDAITYLLFGRASIAFNCTRRYGDFVCFVNFKSL